MTITATIQNSKYSNAVWVSTEGNSKSLSIPAKVQGNGSSINGGELLFAAIATCFCNDIYREATKRNMIISLVEVNVTGNFGKEGEPGSDISYTAKVESPSSTIEEIDDLIKYVDGIAEIHNTIRRGSSVTLKNN